MAPSRGSTPKSWPADVAFLSDPVPSPALPTRLHRRYCSPLPAEHRPDPSLCAIKVIATPPSHPALGQRGLFAARKLPQGTCVAHYVGVIHTEADANPSSDYDLALDRPEPDLLISVDGQRSGGVARMINDFRGVRERANCAFELETIEVSPTGPGDDGKRVRMAVRVRRFCS